MGIKILRRYKLKRLINRKIKISHERSFATKRPWLKERNKKNGNLIWRWCYYNRQWS